MFKDVISDQERGKQGCENVLKPYHVQGVGSSQITGGEGHMDLIIRKGNIIINGMGNNS